ncbi:hypothetical protein UlMin_003353 [Ulmus minor]
MDLIHLISIFSSSIILFIFFWEFSIAADTITQIQSLTDGQTLVSSGKTFELGFFSPGKSKNRYVGIWYKATPDAVVWVANRYSPISDFSGELIINNHTNQLLLLNQSRTIVWSSNSSNRIAENPVARLLDSGNLVFGEIGSFSSELYLWQSFDYPTDTLLAGMKLGWDLSSGLERSLTSWKSDDDPSIGDSSFRMNITGLPQVISTLGTTIKFRSGPWNGVRFSGVLTLGNVFIKDTVEYNDKEVYYMIFPAVNSVTCRVRINNSGLAQRLIMRDNNKWAVMYSRPYEPCDNYEFCGVNGICRINLNQNCDCLEGFIPTYQDEWEVLNWSNGCKRKRRLDCQKGEGFVKVSGVKLPALLNFSLDKAMSLDECKEACLKNCSCKAYANSDVRRGSSGCLMWFGDLIDVREFRVEGSDQDMYIRLSASEMKLIHNSKKKKRLKIITLASTISGICFLALLLWCLIWTLRKRGKVKGRSKDEDIELPLFDLATIAAATNNFSPENMIGSGGFGPVYKGNLSTGKDIAVKRLSKDSGQGISEFKNEIDLIAKLQHKNLVALLGCCIQREERMLIYEYMPNQSLDYFIFDHKRSTILSWQQSFDIIMGIARGLVYLHQDSKLQIIHRDLKAGNILLDTNLNPKISDFGLARIFDDDEKERRTRRVIGT